MFRGKKDTWRADFASPARATSVSRENNLQSSREQLAILARNESNSREKWKCFSRETKVFLVRNGSVSREKRKCFSREMDLPLGGPANVDWDALLSLLGGLEFGRTGEACLELVGGRFSCMGFIIPLDGAEAFRD